MNKYNLPKSARHPIIRMKMYAELIGNYKK
nr:MAG TPA: hypothetical protein [Caudoviricetes sp.]